MHSSALTKQTTGANVILLGDKAYASTTAREAKTVQAIPKQAVHLCGVDPDAGLRERNEARILVAFAANPDSDKINTKLKAYPRRAAALSNKR
jgi:hypothetical protein